jgi:hypothetical protein
MSVIGELFAVLLAGLQEGDLPGLLRAWWQVATGQVTGETRAQVGGME